MNDNAWIFLFFAGLLFAFVMLQVSLIIRSYKSCASNQILVIFGHGGTRVVREGGAFVWPLLQDYAFLSLEPLRVVLPIRGDNLAEQSPDRVAGIFTVAIGTDPGLVQNAAARLVGLSPEQIAQQAADMIRGQLESQVGSLSSAEIRSAREPILAGLRKMLPTELGKLGLELLHADIGQIAA